MVDRRIKSQKKLSTVTLIFKLPYYTQWGQKLVICGSHPVLGSSNVKQSLALIPSHENNELIWMGQITVTAGFQCEYNYYLVDDNSNILRRESDKKRKFILPKDIKDGEVMEVRDLWQTVSETLFLRSAFKNVIFNDDESSEPEIYSSPFPQNGSDHQGSIIIQFKICCSKGKSVCVIGSASQLGQWRVQDGLKLKYAGDSIWQAECLIRKDEFPLKYKYYKMCEGQGFSMEVGPNRELALCLIPSRLPNYIFISDGSFREMPCRGAGVAVPMFSVRSNDDLGVGEFLDLKLLVDWAAQSGFHLVQLLPVNDTSVHGMWWDSYPYSSLSVFALHPLYLRVQAFSQNIPEDVKTRK